MILALDPGCTESGFCRYHGGRVIDSGILPNGDILTEIVMASRADLLAIEMIASYGMPVGREIFHTCVWIGRFVQTWRRPEEVRLVERGLVKIHLCGSARAKDGNIRQALIDLLGPPGKKAAPGPTYGVYGHAWAALAVAVTVDGRVPAQSNVINLRDKP